MSFPDHSFDGRVERDLDALEPVALELAPQQLAQRLVEIGDRGVQRNVDDEGHAGRPYPLRKLRWEEIVAAVTMRR